MTLVWDARALAHDLELNAVLSLVLLRLKKKVRDVASLREKGGR